MRAEKTEVLLVEDHTNSLSADLKRAGFAVTEARNVDSAVRALTIRDFDLVLSDLRVAATDGLSLLRQMKEHSLDTPTFLVFEKLDNASAIEATALGALQCLVKPIDAESLKRAGRLAAATRARVRQAMPPTAQPTRFRSRLRGNVVANSVSATDAKNEFGRVLETALRSGAVVITRHESPKAVLLAMDEFESLVGMGARRLDTLSAEFDAMFDTMQAPDFNARMKTAFGATPAELGKVAVAATKRHG